MYGSDHTYSPYRPSPSPYPGTPSPAVCSPGSPGGGGGGEAGAGTDWHTTEVEVRVRAGCEGAGQVGVVRGVTEGSCAVYVPAEDRVLSVPAELLDPVLPQAGDRVKVIAGEDRETVGQLISIENQEGVVKFGTDDIKIMQLRHLCKMSTA